MLTGRTARADGFTLIELVIGMVLLGIVGAVVFSLLLDAIDSGQKTSTRDRAAATATRALELLDADMRAARARDRTHQQLRDLDTLRQVVIRGSAPPISPDSGQPLDLRDVQMATPTVIAFQSDVLIDTPSVECVIWRGENVGAGNWRLVRYVLRYQLGCLGTGSNGPLPPADILDTQIMIPDVPLARAPAQNGVAGNVFAFTLLSQPRPLDRWPNPNTCQKRALNRGLSEREMNQLMTVDLDVRSYLDVSRQSGVQELNSTVAFRTRANWDYLYALGCRSI